MGLLHTASHWDSFASFCICLGSDVQRLHFFRFCLLGCCHITICGFGAPAHLIVYRLVNGRVDGVCRHVVGVDEPSPAMVLKLERIYDNSHKGLPVSRICAVLLGVCNNHLSTLNDFLHGLVVGLPEDPVGLILLHPGAYSVL